MNNRPAFGASMGASFAVTDLTAAVRTAFGSALCALMMMLSTAPAFAQAVTPAGTTIQNSARVSYTDVNGAAAVIDSNSVTAIVAPPPSQSAIAIMRASSAGASLQSTAGPTQCASGSSLITLPAPVLTGGTVADPMQPIALAVTTSLHGGEAAFVQITDPDQNLDSNVVDATDLRLTTPTGDSETLRLSESGPNTGVFVGYIQTRASGAAAGNCVLEVERNTQISSTYVDPFDARDTASASALVDPYGLIFDSRTGAPVNGARVRLINDATGASAAVVGDDGLSSYPSEMITGESVTDAGGTVYSLPAGVFRFPLVAPGSYRVEVLPPAGHVFPSALSVAELAQTPGAPYRVNAGSFGGAFAADAAPAVAVDVPVDAAASQLFMQKSTTTTVAAIGDFVQYTLTVENISTSAAVASVRTIDQLPLGARYRKGSTRIGGEVAADPQIAADGQTLTFTTGSLGSNQRIEFRYVVEITVGARGKQLVNTAQAVGPDGLASNSAQATIQMREELFRDRAIVMGRVGEGDCATPANQLQGVAGVRVYLEDGRYSVTDEDGKYHFEDVAPGSHVVQIDPVTIPDTHRTLTCSDRVRQAGRAYSQFIDVRGGALWRSDFVLERKPLPKGSVTLEMQTKIASTGSARTQKEGSALVEGIFNAQLLHTIALNVAGVPVDNVRIFVMLPDGLAYQAGSARLGNAPLADPSNTSNVLTFPLDALAADAASLLTFRTGATAGSSGAINIRTVAVFDSPSQAGQRTAPAENVVLRGEMLYESASYRFSPRFDALATQIQPADREQLEKIVSEWRGVTHLRLSAIGHSDQTVIAARSHSTFVDNDALSRARAEAVASYLIERLKIDPSRVTVEGRGDREPLADGHDAQSLALNRRVEIAIEGLRIVAAGGLTLKTASSRSEPVQTVGVLGGSASTSVRASDVKSAVTIEQPIADVEALQPAIGWVLPQANAVPAIPSIKVAVQHLPTQRAELLINGAAVNALNFDGAATNQAKTVSLSRWRGVDLRDGDNELIAVVRGADGDEVQRLTRKIHYSGGAVRAELVREASTLLADGRTRPTIALRMTDASGEPARPGTLGAFRVEAPYRSWWEVQSLDDNKLVSVGEREPVFSVDEDGVARLELEPTTQAGTAIIRLRFNERRTQEIRVWLEPQARDWILVGIAEGTATYDTISDNMQSAEQAGLEDGYADDGRIAFFAKGAVKGEFLLTAAYDSAREHEFEKDRLLGVVEPDRFYTLYGDATEQRFEAATTRKLFLKVERRQFAALFGDFETGLTVTELSRYSRTFTGFKSDYAGEHFGYTAFAAESEQGYVKDELQGDGTSGLYRLSRRPLIVNSDKVRIEVRDRFRSEVIVESRPLTPFIDYSIDYLNGTLFFKQPVPSRDANFNPVFIIAEYEVLNGGEAQLTAGGRAAVKLADDRIEVGASYLQEGAATGDARVAGTDLRWQIGAATELRAEIARSESDDPAVDDASAYLTELTHFTEELDARVYVREQEAGFGVGQQLSTETGTRKIGVDGRYRLMEQLSLEAETYRQEVLTTGAERELVSAELRHEADDYSLGAGARRVVETDLTNGDTESQQAFVNGSIDLFKDLITLRASQDLALGGRNSSVDFPARSVLGLDYHWRADTTFFAEYEHANGDQLDTDMTRVGVRTTPWERAQLQSSMNQQATEYGPRVFANVGLTQGWQLNDRWGFDLGVDQSKTVRGPELEPFNANVPLASGTLSNDFLATFVGAMYRSDLWTFTSRLESRTSDDEDRLVAAGGFYREPIAGHAFSLATQWFDSQFANGSDAMAGDIQLAWAYRPVASQWIILNRLDLKHESRSDALGEFESARAINNLNSNWQLDARTQLGLQFGARYVRSTFDGERYSGFSGLYGLDMRRDLNERFDVGVHGTLLNSMSADVSDQSLGVDLGVTLARNVWVSIGYNFAGFRDDDFEASRYTAQGPFIKFRMKADQDTFKDLSLDALRAGK
ncbi:MAG: OmpA family protein [Steroidobacter sp.]